MKISKLFHWLYASLCFLPLLVAPIFALAVRSDNNFTPISINVTKKEDLIGFQGSYNTFENNNINTDYITTNADLYFSSGYHQWSFDGSGEYFYVDLTINLSVNINDIIYVSFDMGCDENSYDDLEIENSIGSSIALFYADLGSMSNLNNNKFSYQCETNGVYSSFYFQTEDLSEIYLKNLQVFNLTQIYGSGNEPTINEFYDFLNGNVFDYGDNVIGTEDIIVTYNDTDVGSQLLYTLYNTTDKYLNFDDVLNLKLINNWINLNVFNGNAPLIWTIIWHYLDYWLLLSIFWLCFDILIYVPQIAHRWLDKASLE